MGEISKPAPTSATSTAMVVKDVEENHHLIGASESNAVLPKNVPSKGAQKYTPIIDFPTDVGEVVGLGKGTIAEEVTFMYQHISSADGTFIRQRLYYHNYRSHISEAEESLSNQ